MNEILKLIPGGTNNPEIVIIVGIVVAFLILILGILWIIVPFAIFGTKPKLEEILSENRNTSALLMAILRENKNTNERLEKIIVKIKSMPKQIAGSGISEELIENNNEKRRHPRLDFISLATVMGQDAKITDFSMGGLFLEMEKPSAIKIGKTMNIDLSLPTEYDPIRVKVKCINQNEKGIGCQFVDLTPDNKRAIGNCFEEFRSTIPIRE